MNILCACEFSGIVSTAFREKGHTVLSLDFLPSESPGNHMTGNIEHALSMNWDMIIAFPPCTFLTSAASWRWNDTQLEIKQSLVLIEKIWNANARFICIENPTGWLNNNWKQPNQILSPHFFGSRFRKRTCFWLKNLPPLIYTYHNQKPRSLVKQFGSGHNKPKLRSKFKPELAEAMAIQWNFI